MGYQLGVWKGYSWTPYLGIDLGFLIGLIGIGILALIPSTPSGEGSACSGPDCQGQGKDYGCVPDQACGQ